jgi:hypothetical protein
MTGPTPRAAAELLKLAHALDVDPSRVAMVAGLPADDLRALRAQVTEALFQADRHFFARMAALTKTVPGSVAAKLSEAVLPPIVAARTAELLEPERAADFAGRLSEKYLADVSTFLDAARAPEIVAAIPPERVRTVAVELARRGEWIVIGSFVAQVTDEALAAAVAEFDGEQLLRIGFVLDDLSRLDKIGGYLTDRQIDDLLAAAGEFGLWIELQELLEHFAPERVARLAARYSAAEGSVRARFEEAAASGALDPSALGRLSAA